MDFLTVFSILVASRCLGSHLLNNIPFLRLNLLIYTPHPSPAFLSIIGQHFIALPWQIVAGRKLEWEKEDLERKQETQEFLSFPYS